MFLNHRSLRAALLFALSATASAQVDWYVDQNAPTGGDGSAGAPFLDIGSAVAAAAQEGDTVRVAPGVYPETIQLVGKSLDLVTTAGAGSVVVDAAGAGSALALSGQPPGSRLTVRGIEFRGGTGTPDGGAILRGGGVLAEGPARTSFVACSFTGNTAAEGGGVYLAGGIHDFVDCTFQGNAATTGAGLLSLGAELYAMNCVFRDNQAPAVSGQGQATGVGFALYGPRLSSSPTPLVRVEFCEVSRNASAQGAFGSGVYAAVPARISDTRFLDNARPGGGSIGGYGGGLYAASTGVELFDCEFRGNGERMSNGGGISGDVTASRCQFIGNEAAEGGGVYLGTYEDCLFESNTGGGLCCAEGALGGGASRATLLRCTLRGNQVTDGIALQGAGAFASTLRGSVVEYNFQGEVGFGGARSGAGLASCTAVDTVIRGNSGVAGAGASESTLYSCQLIENMAWEVGGGAVTSTLVGCSILRNSAGDHGGGVAGQCTLERCVVSGNRSTRGAGASGSDLSFCTVTGNMASDRVGGVSADTVYVGPFFSGSASLQNSIVYANQPTDLGEIQGPFGNPVVAASWTAVTGGWPGVGNLAADGDVVGPLSGNAQLLFGSPAIDSADPAAPLDLDGTRADMGAVPFDASYVPAPMEFCVGKENGLGVLPLLGWSGSPAVSATSAFVLLGSDLNGQSFALVAAAPAAAYTSAFGGTICLGAGLTRLGVVPSGGTAGGTDGAFAVPLDSAQLAAFGVGSLVYAQALVRDAHHPDGSGAALTAGLEFRVLP